MATQKPISTISYNTEPFLREKLDGLIKSHAIQAYQYIKHKGEDGDKDHIHLRIEPNKRIDPMAIQDLLREFLMNNDKPLACLPFRPSKEEDWFLYAVHDPDYLKIKYKGGEKGEKLPYKWQDIKASEYYDVEVAFLRARQHLEHTSASIVSRIQNGEKPVSLISMGENPYMINAITRALAENDYLRLYDEHARLSEKLSQAEGYIDCLESAITRMGYEILTDDDGNIILV